MVTDGMLTATDLQRLRAYMPYRRSMPWRTVVFQAAALWLATRLLDAALTMFFVSGTIMQRLNAWWFYDAAWYGYIAQHGYKAQSISLAPFFPLYPLLLHPLQSASEMERIIADLAIGNVGTLGAFIAVGLLATHEARDAQRAWWAMLALAVSPLAIFLAGAYSDGLFIALAAGALFAARTWHWRWASVLLSLAIITRPFGVILALALALEYAQQRAWRLDAIKRNWREVATLIGLPVGTFGGYIAVLWRQDGDPFAILHAEGASRLGSFRWGHGFRWPWQTLELISHELQVLPHWSWPTAHLAIDLLPVLLCLVIAAVTMRQAPASFTLLTLGVALICLMTPIVTPTFPDPIASSGRYCYAAVPLLLTVAAWMQCWPRWLVVFILGTSLVLQCALTVFVLHGGWLV